MTKKAKNLTIAAVLTFVLGLCALTTYVAKTGKWLDARYAKAAPTDQKIEEVRERVEDNEKTIVLVDARLEQKVIGDKIDTLSNWLRKMENEYRDANGVVRIPAERLEEYNNLQNDLRKAKEEFNSITVTN